MDEKVKKLNLCSGLDYKEGWINLDFNPDYKHEVLWDLTKLPIPFPDNEFDEIIAIHCIEHFHDPLNIVNELWRIGKPGCKITIKVPHFSSPFSKGDLTHHHQFSTRDFSHFELDPVYYNSKTRFKVKTSLNCVNARGRLWAKIYNFIFNPIVNFNFSLTENVLCKFIAIYENIYELTVIK